MAIVLKEDTSLNSMVRKLKEEKARLIEEEREVEKERDEIKKDILFLKKKYEKEGKRAFNRRFGRIYFLLAITGSVAFAVICLLNKNFKDLSVLVPWGLSLISIVYIYNRAKKADVKRFLKETTGVDIDFVASRYEMLTRTSKAVEQDVVALASEISRKGAEIAGNRGEQTVINYIKNNFGDDTYLINDIRIQNEGKSTQIDHILVSPRGVFCIETKNYASAYTILNEEKWSFYKQGEMITINSPISQSLYHTQMLSDILSRSAQRVVPLVIFTNNRGSVNGRDNRCKIIKANDLLRFVKGYKKVYSNEQTRELAYKILALNII